MSANKRIVAVGGMGLALAAGTFGGLNAAQDRDFIPRIRKIDPEELADYRKWSKSKAKRKAQRKARKISRNYNKFRRQGKRG